MLISYNLLKELISFDLSPDEFEQSLTMLGIEVESITNLKDKYKNFISAHIIEVNPHPDADKFTICRANIGKEETQVICGAPNVKAGQKVIIGLPGSILPRNNQLLERRSIRNVESSGIICSLWELDLGDDHSGIWILDDNIEPGISLSELKFNDDVIMEIGITPNRADCLSHFGIAREISALIGKPFDKREIKFSDVTNSSKQQYQVIIEDIDKCQRYSARIIRGVSNSQSPEWLILCLVSLGFRPVNTIVDITNYVLITTGQPLHAFDLERLNGVKVIMKPADDGQKFITLDEKERILDNDMLMICDETKSIAIGGIMGGQNSEISLETQNILLESAYFDPRNIRRTAKKLGISSEASYRFERGVDPDGIIYASDLASSMIQSICGGIIEEPIIDCYPKKIENNWSKLRYDRTRKLIGCNISNNQILDIIEKLNFETRNHSNGGFEFKAPSYRVEISEEIDAIEEVARLYNYDNIPSDFSSTIDFRTGEVPNQLKIPQLRQEIRRFLVPKGFVEILTQNQTHPRFAKLFNPSPIFISNPLGEELSVMRTSLIPSILKTIALNINFGSKNLRLFEIGKVFIKDTQNLNTVIPNVLEKEHLVIAISGSSEPNHWSREQNSADYYDIKGIVEELIDYFKLDNFIKFESSSNSEMFTKQCQTLIYKDTQIAYFGMVNKNILNIFEVEADIYLVNLDLSEIYKIVVPEPVYIPVSAFPKVARDLAFLVDSSITSEELKQAIRLAGGEFLQSLEVFDVYKGENIETNMKSIAFSIYFQSKERTLTDADIQPAISNIEKSLYEKYKAVLRKA